MTWLALKAWPWLKKHWMWILLPIGILIYIAGYTRAPKVVASEMTGAEKAKREADNEATEKVAKAKAERDKRLAGVTEEHKSALDELTDEQKEKVDELLDDPDALSEYLKNVSDQIRG